MKVKELKDILSNHDDERDIIIKFALSENDEIGYVLEPYCLYDLFNDKTVLCAEYETSKEDCDFIGQVDLKTLWEREMKE